MGIREQLADPRSPDRRPRRAAYALPTLFTAGNIFLGYLSILRSFRGANWPPPEEPPRPPRRNSSRLPPGPSARPWCWTAWMAASPGMTNTTSEFGREMDSLADVISFGMAPAVLAFAWGVQFVDHSLAENVRTQLLNAGYFISFLFLICGAARLARFNVQKNPIPKNPGRPDRKYFVGMPIPAAAGMVAAVVYACEWRAARVVGLLGGLAGAAGPAGFPHGEHLALQQLQSHQSLQALHHRCSSWRRPG